ncbi:4a-hydroxytetrahydrobiopterin dehydratase family protein [Emticicia fontis]
MFNFFKSNKEKSSGVFIPKGASFIEVEREFKIKSFNEIAKDLGYHPDMLNSYSGGYFEDKEIYTVAFKQFTKDIAFVSTNETVISLDRKRVERFLKKIDFDFEYDAPNVEDILERAIENKSLSVDYLQEVLGLNDNSPDGILYSERLGYYLHFNDGYLSDYQPADGLNEWAKDWKQINPGFIFSYEKEAQYYWGENNTQKILQEINTQAEAYADTPASFQNPNIELHRSKFGNINFWNLLVVHHGKKVSLKEFLEINHGRYKFLGKSDDLDNYQVGNNIFTFDEDGNIIVAYNF